MKKIFLTILVVLIAAGIGFVVGRMSSTCEYTIDESQVDTTNGANETNSTDNTNTQQAAPITIETDSLTEGQQAVAETLGINSESITITPQMIACAEAKIGKERVAEIKNGATPTFLEGLDLVACYQQ